jgi:diguanylate cyclase (GGDEF)-like protein/PAS domain S-box-containing protein
VSLASHRLPPLWVTYLLAGGIVLALYELVGPLHDGPLFNVVGLSASIAIAVGAHRNRPEHRGIWYLIAVGMALFAIGDVIAYNYPALFGEETPFPSLADPLYLAVYPCVYIGVLGMIRARRPGRDIDGLLDSAVIALGLGAVSWVVLVSPIASAADLPLDAKLVGMAYPIFDLVLLSVLVRLSDTDHGRNRIPSRLLMTGGALALLAVDSVYSFVSIHGITYDQAGVLEVGWAAFYLLWGAAALHPSMRKLTERTHNDDAHLTFGRLAMIFLAVVTTQVVEFIVGGEREFVSEITIVMSILVALRVGGLIRRLLSARGRELTLSEAGTALVAAADESAVRRAAIVAAGRLATGGQPTRAFLLMLDEERHVEFVAAEGSIQPVLGSDVDRIVMDVLPRDRSGLIELGEVVRRALGLTPSLTYLSSSPLSVQDGLAGWVVVGFARRPAASFLEGLASLAAQVGLALESHALAQAVAVSRNQDWFSSIVQNSSDLILVIGLDSTIAFVSPISERIIGRSPADLAGKPLIDLVSPDDAARVAALIESVAADVDATIPAVEFRIRHADGRWLHVEALSSNLLRNPSINGIVLNLRDISERKAFEEQLTRRAFYDPLTNLPNRALFRDRVEHALERRRRAAPVAVLFLDLDDLKADNDSLGHAAGDKVLTEVGERLRRCVRASETVARFGGDEFAVLVEGTGRTPADVADRILGALEAPITLDGTEVVIGASIGIAEATPGRQGKELVAELLQNADVAMSAAKAKGKGRWQMFESRMREALMDRLALTAALDRAIADGELIVHYQPVVALGTGLVDGLEALVRWDHPERGLIQPIEFIPLAEQTGQIVAIGRQVLLAACRFAAGLRTVEPGGRPLHVAVNLSARQIQRVEIIDEVRDILAETGLDPSRLVLEITESVMMADADAMIERLHLLKALGVRLAIDDFGTGYSSLNYLRTFPVDIVKIDRSFVAGIAEDDSQRAVVAAIVELAGIRGLQQVAEGIESADELAELRRLGCDFGQGYFFARPLPESMVESYLTAHGSIGVERRPASASLAYGAALASAASPAPGADLASSAA